MKEKTTSPKPRRATNNAAGQKPTPEHTRMYMELFVRKTDNATPDKKYKLTEISPENVRRIRRILINSDDSASCSVKAFVNNVLAEHFRKYADVINKIIES